MVLILFIWTIKSILLFLLPLDLDFCNCFLGMQQRMLQVLIDFITGVRISAVRFLHSLISHRVDQWWRADLLLFESRTGIRQLFIVFLNSLLFDRTVFILKFFEVFYVTNHNWFIHKLVYVDMPRSIQLEYIIILELLVQLHLLLIKLFLLSSFRYASFIVGFRHLGINWKIITFLCSLFGLLSIFYVCKYTALRQITCVIFKFGPAWVSHHRSRGLVLRKHVFVTII